MVEMVVMGDSCWALAKPDLRTQSVLTFGWMCVATMIKQTARIQAIRAFTSVPRPASMMALKARMELCKGQNLWMEFKMTGKSKIDACTLPARGQHDSAHLGKTSLSCLKLDRSFFVSRVVVWCRQSAKLLSLNRRKFCRHFGSIALPNFLTVRKRRRQKIPKISQTFLANMPKKINPRNLLIQFRCFYVRETEFAFSHSWWSAMPEHNRVISTTFKVIPLESETIKWEWHVSPCWHLW